MSFRHVSTIGRHHFMYTTIEQALVERTSISGIRFSHHELSSGR